MNYFVKRDTQEYGPYTLSELQRYTSTGNVLLTDLCRSEGMVDWVPVSQVIGNIPVAMPAAAPGSIAPAYAPSPYPPPPNLHWGVVLLLGIVTCGIFAWVWVFVQSAWMKKVAPANKALLLYGISVGLIVLAILLNVASPQLARGQGIAGLLNLAGGILWLVASFNLKSGIEEHFSTAEPVPSAMSLSGVMTFFFNVYYFQYHFTKINELKKQQGFYVG